MAQFVNSGTPATIEIIGVDGSSWTVSGESQGHEGVELDSGPQGLQEAPRTGNWQQSAFQEGATFMGVSVEPIDLVLGFQIWGDEENWQDVSGRFRKAFDYERLATIRVSTESGTRELGVQLFETPQRDQDFDPRTQQYSLEVYTLRAPWPYWEGEVESDTSVVNLRSRPDSGSKAWNNLPAALQAMLTADTATPTYSSGTVEVSNPTDVPLWPQWACTAPGRWGIPDYSWNDDEQATRTITTPTLYSGQGLTIDTYPRNEPYVAEDGSNMPGRFGGVLFLNPIPPFTPRQKIPVFYIGADDTAATTIRMRQYWNSPWD